MRNRSLAAIAALVLLLPSPALAADDEPLDPAALEEIRKANAACFECHSPAGIAKPPREGMDVSSLRDDTVAPEPFHASNHGEQKCVECHGGEDDAGEPNIWYDLYPHDPRGKEAVAECADCHAAKVKRINPMFNASVHAESAELKDKFTCATCHDPHVHAVAEKLVDPHLVVAMDNQVCLDCHDSDRKFAEFAPRDEHTGLRGVRPKIDEIHDWLPNTRLHWSAVRCIDCHTPPTPEGKLLSHEIVDAEKAEKNCVTCHSRDTSLNLRLYRHLAEEEQDRLGFTNSVVLRTSYVIGATRHPLLELLVWLALAGAVVGVLGHGLARFIASRRRNKGQ